MLLDLGNVKYVSSALLGALVGLHKELLAAGRRLILRNLRPQVLEVFLVARLDEFLDLGPAEPGWNLQLRRLARVPVNRASPR